MFENCKTYNRQDSRLYKDGCRLQRVLKLKLDEIEAGSGNVPFIYDVIPI